MNIILNDFSCTRDPCDSVCPGKYRHHTFFAAKLLQFADRNRQGLKDDADIEKNLGASGRTGWSTDLLDVPTQQK